MSTSLYCSTDKKSRYAIHVPTKGQVFQDRMITIPNAASGPLALVYLTACSGVLDSLHWRT
jgi:hypothetical protein